MIFLENEFLKAVFVHKGGELQSLKNKKINKEYLWNGNPDYWGKHSPVLFPVVGGLKNGTYYFEDKEYKLPRHGFARDNKLEVQQHSKTELTFTFNENPETLKVYPFRFTLNLHYKIDGSKLSCTYQVLNPGDKELLFSVGGHPALAAPTGKNIQYTDYYLEFNKDDQLTYHKIKGDLIANETSTIDLKDHILPLNHQLFYQDALVFKTLKSNQISLKNTKDPHGLHFYFNGFPYFGIWAAKDADFVCLEPWCGIADGVDHDQALKDKEGIVLLPPKESWARTWSIACF